MEVIGLSRRVSAGEKDVVSRWDAHIDLQL